MTIQGVSSNPGWMVLTSLVTFTLLYGVLAVVWFYLMRKAALKGIPIPQRDEQTDELDTPAISFGY